MDEEALNVIKEIFQQINDLSGGALDALSKGQKGDKGGAPEGGPPGGPPPEGPPPEEPPPGA